MVKAPLTRGHKKKARTRQALLEAALRIYAQKGIGELALKELAVEANVSNGTVYNYFRTREEVLEAVGLELAEDLSQQISILSEAVENGAHRVSIGIKTFMRKAEEDADWARSVIRVFQLDRGMRSAVAFNLRKDLQTAKNQKLFTYECEAAAMTLVASATIGAMTTIVDGLTVPDFERIMVKMVLMGLGMSVSAADKITAMDLPRQTGLPLS